MPDKVPSVLYSFQKTAVRTGLTQQETDRCRGQLFARSRGTTRTFFQTSLQDSACVEDLGPWLGGFPWGSSEPAVRTAQRVKGAEGKTRKPPLWKPERQEGQVQRETVPGQAARNQRSDRAQGAPKASSTWQLHPLGRSLFPPRELNDTATPRVGTAFTLLRLSLS